MSETQTYRLALDSNPDGRYRCVSCGQIAHYMIAYSKASAGAEGITHREYYCEGCCN